MENADLRARLASLVLAADTTIHDMANPQEQAENVADVLIAAGVFVPPADAEVSEGRYVSIAAGTPNPWMGRELHFRDAGQVFIRDDFGQEREITEDYRAWLNLQPATITLTYEWPEPPPTCPECVAGKHLTCAGIALNYADEIVACRCPHNEVP